MEVSSAMSERLFWDHLSHELHRQVAVLPAVAGIAVRDLTAGQSVAINADEVFPTASTIKIHILAQLFRKAEAGELDLRRRITIDESVRVLGSGVLAYLDDTEELTVRDVAILMIIVSDNTATNLCIDWATYEGTNGMLRKLGIEKTTLRRKMQDHAAALRGDENVATPAEIIQFLEILHRANKLSPSVCEETLKILRKPKRGYLAPGLPQDVVLANKPGGMDRVRNDAGIVYLKRRPYAVCVMTKFGIGRPSAQERFIGDVAQIVHEHMTTLDGSSQYGQGVPPQYLG
jgi:beta-lactamase class A